MKRIRVLPAMLLAGALATPANSLPAQAVQIGSALSRTVPYPVAPVPFGPGEEMNYKVEWGIFGDVGYGRLAVEQVDSMHGHPTYNLQFAIKGGVLFAKVDDLMQSWLDVSTLVSRRFDQDQHEVNYKRHRIIDFFPEELRWNEVTNENRDGDLPNAEPLDDVSFLYFVRTLPLVVGESYTFDRYWKDEGNPVVVNVLRKDSITIGQDTYHTIVVQPIIKTKGIFSEGGEAEVHFSDDSRRLIVHLRAKMSIGTLKMWLEDYTPGRKLRSSVPAETGDAGGGLPVPAPVPDTAAIALPENAPGVVR